MAGFGVLLGVSEHTISSSVLKLWPHSQLVQLYVVWRVSSDTVSDVRTVAGDGRVLRVRGEHLPMVALNEYYRYGTARSDDPLVVVVEADGQKLALEVDELIGQQQVVVKNLENNYRRIDGISGATSLGDGRVALIVDVGGLVRARRMQQAA